MHQGAHVANLEEQTLEIRELSAGQTQQANVIVEDGTGRRLVRFKCICGTERLDRWTVELRKLRTSSQKEKGRASVGDSGRCGKDWGACGAVGHALVNPDELACRCGARDGPVNTQVSTWYNLR